MFRLTLAVRLSVAAAALTFLASAAGPTCYLLNNGCSAKMTLKPYTGSPTVPCLNGHPVVQIDTRTGCGQSFYGPVRVLRCGISSEGFSFTDQHGVLHSFTNIADWETALYGDCDVVLYSAS